MSSGIDQQEQNQRNQAVVEAVRAIFGPLLGRLSPAVEPATVYTLPHATPASVDQNKDRE